MSNNRCLVISGGGAMGAFGCGVSEALTIKHNNKYELIIGTSTGSLQMGLIGLGNFDKLKESYLNVTQKSIFNWNPFNKKGKPSIWKALLRIILNKDSLGESKNLKKLIDKFFTIDDYNELKEKNIEIKAVTISMTDKKAYAKSNKYNSYEDMKDWIWASANSPTFMSFLKKDGHKWTDGGLKQHTPIQDAIDMGYTDIDVIVHRPKTYEESKKWEGKGIIKNLLRIIQILSEDVSENDIEIAKLRALDKDINLNIYYTPYKLAEQSLLFDKKIMTEWWDLGYDLVDKDTCDCSKIIIKK